MSYTFSGNSTANLPKMANNVNITTERARYYSIKVITLNAGEIVFFLRIQFGRQLTSIFKWQKLPVSHRSVMQCWNVPLVISYDVILWMFLRSGFISCQFCIAYHQPVWIPLQVYNAQKFKKPRKKTISKHYLEKSNNVTFLRTQTSTIVVIYLYHWRWE